MRELNVTVFGASRSGKTQLITRFIQNTFSATYDATIEDLYRKEYKVDGTNTSLKILDTQGVEQFHAMRKAYIDNANAFLVTYDTSDAGSISELSDLIDQILSLKAQNVPLVIVGTKSDKHNTREGSGSADAIRIGAKLASTVNKPHFTTSSKQNRQVDTVFESLVRQNIKNESVHRSRSMETSSSTMSSVSIDGWLYAQQQRERGGSTPRHQPSIKKSMLKLRKSMAKIRASKSVRNIRKVMSSASFYKPAASRSSQNLRDSQFTASHAQPSNGRVSTPALDARSKQAEPLSALRDDVMEEGSDTEEDADLSRVTQSKLSEMPNITDVSTQRQAHTAKRSGVCVVM